MVPVEHSLAADRCFTVIHQGRRQMLDHIVVSRRLMGRYRGSEIHNEALTDEVTGYGKPSPVSYHAPVVAEFDLRAHAAKLPYRPRYGRAHRRGAMRRVALQP